MSPLLWFAVWLAGLQVRPAPRPDAGNSRASIQGVVVRAGAAGAAAPQQLPEARVELKPGNVSVLTGADGAFTFQNLTPGRYTLSVSRDGFIPQEDRLHGLTVSGLSVNLAAGQTLKDVVLPMIAAPVIAGTVFDPRGEPLATALVQAYTRRYTPYGTQLKIVKRGMTDDLGEFRLFGLNFGEYFISAGYGDRERTAAIGNTVLSPNVSKPDDGYATMFYDGAEDISRAQAAHLAPGSDAGTLNIGLRNSPRFKIRGQVLPVIGGTKIVLAPKGSDLSEAAYFTQPTASGAFEIRALSPGAYVLLATTDDGTLSSDVIGVNVVDSDIDGVRLTLEKTMSVSGGVVLERSVRATLSGLHVKLRRSTTEFDQQIDVPVAPDGTFTLQHVAPLAEYDVTVEPLPQGAYMKSAVSGGRNVLPGKSRLLPDQLLQLTLTAATDGLDVHVIKGILPAVGANVVLIPEPLHRRRADRYVSGFTDESGDLHLTAVPPGRYTAYAFEQIEQGAYYAIAYTPAAENRFKDRAVIVNIGENGTKMVELRVIPAAETAGGLQ